MASFSSFLKVFGSDVKKVFSWLTGPQAQTIITTGESIAIAIDPALAPILALVNVGIKEAIKIEGLASAAGQQSGTGAQKLAALVATLTPAIYSAAASLKVPIPDQQQVTEIANSVVTILNSFGPPAA